MNPAQLIEKLTVYRNIIKDETVQALLKLSGSSENKEAAFGRFYFKLAEAAEKDLPYLTNGWQNHLVNLIIADDNPFTREASKKGTGLNPSLYQAAAHDLKCLKMLFSLNDSLKVILNRCNDMVTPLPRHGSKLAQTLAAADDWQQCLDDMINHYYVNGVGIFGRYHALRWDGEKKCLVGVENPDPIQLSDLIGYHTERQQVLDNTEAFLAGYPANNVLLYGDRGTGKSSTVKALVHTYGSKGLRVIEMPKQYLVDFPTVVQQLKKRPQHFILFVDDLSFEEFEVEYKTLKAVLEGGLEAKPQNLLIYATSNRRHLIRESFRDRQQDDIHAGDTAQEKLSLADRFGLTVTFVAPNQKQYLEIVEGLAAQRKIDISREQLHRLALQWELSHSGRSGRVARQFIDYLEGKIRAGV